MVWRLGHWVGAWVRVACVWRACVAVMGSAGYTHLSHPCDHLPSVYSPPMRVYCSPLHSAARARREFRSPVHSRAVTEPRFTPWSSQAFQSLIFDKGRMAPPEDWDGRTEQIPRVADHVIGGTARGANAATRCGGGRMAPRTAPTVVVRVYLKANETWCCVGDSCHKDEYTWMHVRCVHVAGRCSRVSFSVAQYVAFTWYRSQASDFGGKPVYRRSRLWVVDTMPLR